MNNNNENNDEYSNILQSQVLTQEEPIDLIKLLSTGQISKIDCWRILQLIHCGECNCNLPQYGLLTVFSLAKDYKQFTELYDQGCDMLRKNNILTDEIEELQKKRILKIVNDLGIDIHENLCDNTKTSKKPNKNNKKHEQSKKPKNNGRNKSN